MHLNIVQHQITSSLPYVSKAFLAASTIFLTSCTPLSTTFSICVPAFFKSSGLADFANCIALSFFCCPCLAFLTALFATSPAFAAALTVAFLDSAVGTGMGMESKRGFWPVGSAWGVRFKFADWIVEVIGLRCCVSSSVLSCLHSLGSEGISPLVHQLQPAQHVLWEPLEPNPLASQVHLVSTALSRLQVLEG
jgi:hypothetical protein